MNTKQTELVNESHGELKRKMYNLFTPYRIAYRAILMKG